MADKVLHIDSSEKQYGKVLSPISGDLDDLEPANEDFEPLAIAVYQMGDGEPYWVDGYCDDGYVELGDGDQPAKVDELLTDPPCWHKVLFDTLVSAYEEVESMGVDPVELIRKWKQNK